MGTLFSFLDSIVSVVLVIAFIALCIIVFWPQRVKGFEDASKYPLKEDGEVISPKEDKVSENMRNEQ